MTICDCHIHVFKKGIERSEGAYRPPEKDIADYIMEEARENGITRAVLIQASVDGTDNSGLIEAIANAPKEIALRGVAMIGPDTKGLEKLAAAGIRAARVQDRERIGINHLDLLPAIAARAAEVDWHVELNTEPQRFDAVAMALGQMPAAQRLVLDHFGHVDPDSPEEEAALFRLLDTDRVWIKMAPTRVSNRVGSYEDLAGLVSRLVTSYAERCLWGSDWPQVMTPPPIPRNAPMLALCRSVLTEPQQRQVFETNPEALYRF